jgi:hypothetical protein
VSDPKRLLEDWNDDLGRAALRAAARDVPPASAKERAKAVAIGALAPTAAALTTAMGTSAVATGAIGLTKVVAFIGVAGVALVAGTVYLSSAEKHIETPSPTTANAIHTAAPSALASPTPSALTQASDDASAPPLASAVVVTSRSATTAPARAPTVAPQPSTAPSAPVDHESALAGELSSLDRARSALAQGNASQALALLDDYSAHFPRGALSTEATVLRIEALVRSGDRASAITLAHAFLAANATSPYAPRVRSLIGESSAP